MRHLSCCSCRGFLSISICQGAFDGGIVRWRPPAQRLEDLRPFFVLVRCFCCRFRALLRPRAPWAEPVGLFRELLVLLLLLLVNVVVDVVVFVVLFHDLPLWLSLPCLQHCRLPLKLQVMLQASSVAVRNYDQYRCWNSCCFC